MKNKKGQIAIFGASADIASGEDIQLAARCGEELAKLGLSLVVGGDDGVMGAAANAMKRHGGAVVAVVSRQKDLNRQELFDAVIDTGLGWIQFSDAIIRSVQGALVIGGGAGTIGELALMYLNQLPFALIGSESQLSIQFGGRPLDPRGLVDVPVFEDPRKAILYVLAQSEPVNSAPKGAIKEAWEIHCESYPFGSQDDYLPSARRFLEAAISGLAKEQLGIASKAKAHFQDALGDHFYYHVGDHFRAASHYSRALHTLNESREDGNEEFGAYLTAITIESLAIGLEDMEQIDLATQLYAKAADSYRSALKVSDEASHVYLRHSATGLDGDYHRLTAVMQMSQGSLGDAQDSVDRAEKSYKEALSILPRWGESNLSDSYGYYMEKLRAIRDEIARDKEIRRL